MRRNHFIIVGSGLAITGGLISMSGCDGSADTDQPPCKGVDCQSSTSSTTTSSGTSGGGGGGGAGGGAPTEPTCDGNPDDIDPATMQPKVFNKDCSVFALFGAKGSQDGTMENPYATLQEAIKKSNGRWVIACNKASFAENMTTTNNVRAYGGYGCADLAQWKRDKAAKTVLQATSSGTVTLTMQNNPNAEVYVRFQDFALKGPKATAPGASSISVVVDDKVSAELVSSEVTAEDGQLGIPGALPPFEMLDGVQPTTVGTDACNFTAQGGLGATKICADGGQSKGGDGGNGGVLGTSTGKGLPGTNGDNPDATHGTGGKGAPDAATACTPGQAGAKGANGAPGLGGSAIGNLSLTGITGGEGAPGGTGTRGHGGGGGGGGLHAKCGATSVDGPGGSGGGGGSGACGGKGGGGGKAGGSSIAIISLGTNLKLTEVTLTTGIGGKGGNGVIGAAGGTGGLGGPAGIKSSQTPLSGGCIGGKGGDGGDGGPGGGGRGGHSIGVLYKVMPPTSAKPDTVTQKGGGDGGGTTGGPGIKAACLVADNKPCPP